MVLDRYEKRGKRALSCEAVSWCEMERDEERLDREQLPIMVMR